MLMWSRPARGRWLVGQLAGRPTGGQKFKRFCIRDDGEVCAPTNRPIIFIESGHCPGRTSESINWQFGQAFHSLGRSNAP